MVVEADSVEELALEAGEEALGHGVVMAAPDRAHRGDDPRLAAPLPEGQRGVLAALVGMMDDRGGASLSECHVERCEHQLGTQVIGHRQLTTRRLNTSSATAR